MRHVVSTEGDVSENTSSHNILSNSGIIIPVAKSPPFLIAAFLGKTKPDLDEFLADLIAELGELSMHNATPTSSVVVDVLCIICDSPVRFWLSGKQRTNSATQRIRQRRNLLPLYRDKIYRSVLVLH